MFLSVYCIHSVSHIITNNHFTKKNPKLSFKKKKKNNKNLLYTTIVLRVYTVHFFRSILKGNSFKRDGLFFLYFRGLEIILILLLMHTIG